MRRYSVSVSALAGALLVNVLLAQDADDTILGELATTFVPLGSGTATDVDGSILGDWVTTSDPLSSNGIATATDADGSILGGLATTGPFGTNTETENETAMDSFSIAKVTADSAFMTVAEASSAAGIDSSIHFIASRGSSASRSSAATATVTHHNIAIKAGMPMKVLGAIVSLSVLCVFVS